MSTSSVHADFDAVLKQHVDEQGLVNYAALKADPTQLNAYLEALARVKLDDLSRDQQLATMLNAYNAFTLKLVVEHYPIKSIRDIAPQNRWLASRWNLGGTIVNLDELEHQIIRPRFNEPRVHFALVCAAADCPPLQREAYTADRLEQQLDAQARLVHASPRWFEFDAPAGRLRLTSLYDWFKRDFEQAAGSSVLFAARYSVELKQAIDAGRSIAVEFKNYDWSLNDQAGR